MYNKVSGNVNKIHKRMQTGEQSSAFIYEEQGCIMNYTSNTDYVEGLIIAFWRILLRELKS